MKNDYYEPNGFRNGTGDNNGCNDCVNTKNSMMPSCDDDSFCVATPENRNNGILTMAFVDIQPLESVYPQEIAFCNGTLFPNLNKPFYGGRKR